jgi:hypothetical protein
LVGYKLGLFSKWGRVLKETPHKNRFMHLFYSLTKEEYYR